MKRKTILSISIAVVVILILACFILLKSGKKAEAFLAFDPSTRASVAGLGPIQQKEEFCGVCS